METINEDVEEVKNEEETKEVVNEVIEEATKEEPIKETEEATKEEPIKDTEEAKPKAKPKKQARSVKVVELVSCPDCDKKMLPKSLRHSHPRNCKGQPTETRPINKQQNSYGTKLKEQMRKEIEEEMKTKYENKKPKEEQIQQQPTKPVRMSEPEHEVSCSIREPPPRIPTARELLASSYAEIRRAKQQEKMEKIARFKTSMF